MSETPIREMKVWQVEYACDQCGGEIEYDGIMLTSHPPKYQHTCIHGNCCHKHYLKYVYPRITYGEV